MTDRWGRPSCPTCGQPIPKTTEQRREHERETRRRYREEHREAIRRYQAAYYRRRKQSA